MRTAFLTSASAWGAITDQEVRRLAGAWADEAAQALIEFPSHGTPSGISSLAALAHDYALRVATNDQQHVQPAINALEAAIDALPEVEAAFTADRFEAETGGEFALTPLWPRGAPNAFTQPNDDFRALMRAEPEAWSFWLRWWEAVELGKPLPSPLLRHIALIPDDIWQQGPKAVAVAIAEIEARHDLLRQVTDLRQQVAALQAVVLAPGAAIAHRSHNHPPELVDLPAELVQHAASLLPPLQQAEAELVKPQPNRAVLRKLAGALATFASAVLRYCGKTADTIVQEGAKVLAIYLAVNPDAVGRVVDGASALAKALTQYLTTFGP